MASTLNSTVAPISDALSIVENITDGFFAVNREWEFSYANRQAEKILKIRREELIGKNIWSLYPGLIGSEFETAYRRSAKENIPVTLTAYYSDHDIWYEVHVYPADNGLSVYFRDATERIRAEEKLRESEQRFRLMADSIPQIVWIIDETGRGVYFNKQWSLYTGISLDSIAPEEITGDFVHPDDHAITMQAWTAAQQAGQIFSVEHRIRSASGEYRWFLVRAEPYRDPQSGKISRWFGTSTDVHDRRLTEAALKSSEKRYRSLFDSIDQGFCIIDVLFDERGRPYDYRFCDVNPSFQQQTGLVHAIGKTMRELAPEHESHWYEIYGRVATNGESIRFENEAKALNRWFDVFASRIEEADGPKVAVLFKDITEQTHLADTLRRSEHAAIKAARQADAERHRLDAVLQAAPVGIVVSDASGAILLTNSAHKHLWGQQHPDAKNMDQFGPWKGWWADHSERHGQRVEPQEWTTARILHGEENPRDIIAIESFDVPPIRRTVLITGAPVKDSQGKIAGAVVAQMDISDRIKAEDALRQADRRKD